jgi:hypothetical protein
MHIAAAFPQALSADDLDPDVLGTRTQDRARQGGRRSCGEAARTIPADILAKRADGAAAKFAKDNALLSQVFVMDNKTPIAAGRRAGRQGRRHQDRAEGLRPLPARRRHRKGRPTSPPKWLRPASELSSSPGLTAGPRQSLGQGVSAARDPGIRGPRFRQMIGTLVCRRCSRPFPMNYRPQFLAFRPSP